MTVAYKYDNPANGTIAQESTTPIDTRNLTLSLARNHEVRGTIQPDASYTTGGYAVSPPKFNLFQVAGVIIEGVNGYDIYYNKATDKFQFFSSGGTEVTNATDLHLLPAAYFEAKGITK